MERLLILELIALGRKELGHHKATRGGVVQLGPRDDRSRQVRVHELGKSEDGVGEVRFIEIGPSEVSIASPHPRHA